MAEEASQNGAAIAAEPVEVVDNPEDHLAIEQAESGGCLVCVVAKPTGPDGLCAGCRVQKIKQRLEGAT
jgi:hypothetical protein